MLKTWRISSTRESEEQTNAVSGAGTDADRILEYRDFCSWPATYYAKTLDLIRIVNPRVLVEVGVAYGYHADFLLTNMADLSYFGVDPYRPDYDDADPFSRDVTGLFQTTPILAFDRLHDAVSLHLSTTYPGRATIYRETSCDASLRFENSSVDVVFVDGDHRSAAVFHDLEDWWPKLRPSGLLVGDDYDWHSVQTAVDQFARRNNLRVLLVREPDSEHVTYLIRKDSVDMDIHRTTSHEIAQSIQED